MPSWRLPRAIPCNFLILACSFQRALGGTFAPFVHSVFFFSLLNRSFVRSILLGQYAFNRFCAFMGVLPCLKELMYTRHVRQAASVRLRTWMHHVTHVRQGVRIAGVQNNLTAGNQLGLGFCQSPPSLANVTLLEAAIGPSNAGLMPPPLAFFPLAGRSLTALGLPTYTGARSASGFWVDDARFGQVFFCNEVSGGFDPFPCLCLQTLPLLKLY